MKASVPLAVLNKRNGQILTNRYLEKRPSHAVFEPEDEQNLTQAPLKVKKIQEPLCEHDLQKMASRLACELSDRIDRAIDLPIRGSLGVGQPPDRSSEINTAHDHQIDVASLGLGCPRHRPIDER